MPRGVVFIPSANAGKSGWAGGSFLAPVGAVLLALTMLSMAVLSCAQKRRSRRRSGLQSLSDPWFAGAAPAAATVSAATSNTNDAAAATVVAAAAASSTYGVLEGDGAGGGGGGGSGGAGGGCGGGGS